MWSWPIHVVLYEHLYGTEEHHENLRIKAQDLLNMTEGY
jgi:hypothetical protein